ncbi:MAG TPA: bifunctional hydroxymethylpyrimidine kinase/phosphomethylpyrimidine kinase [Planctomycetota bacterium]|jgi:hydroxymethylpyrimidine/phosphomethylpyrimidine kinase|nr:bifunctional hydroxymethylpyrimidine kinase/phosphomethylpyrimidine kinase [Planctomycetota bacterium]
MSAPRPVALSVAGLDPTAGAGLLADVRVFLRHGVRPAGVASAWTVQDRNGVHDFGPIGWRAVKEAIRVVCADMKPSAAKTGLLPDAETVEAVAAALPEEVPLVVDPVLASTGGVAFLDARGIAALRAALLPRATLVTPNLDEAAKLAELDPRGSFSARDAARALLEAGCRAVLVKGGHADGKEACDLLFDAEGEEVLTLPRAPGPTPHGTGCALSAAIAARLARGEELRSAVRGAKALVHSMIAAADRSGLGRPRLGFDAEPE